MGNKTPWPNPPQKEAFYGLAGDVVRAVEPHTESDLVAVLIQFLAMFGNMIGRGGHFAAQSTAHHGNLFITLVGETAKARKGSSWGPIALLASRAEPKWADENVVPGLSSGEGLIFHVRDPRRFINGEEDPGVSDKRLLVIEEEFAAVLRVLERQGNTLSPIIRSAWDGKKLKTLTKTNPITATNAHISIVGHITKDELQRYLSQTESANGFGNRFQWYCVKRSKLLPEGGFFHEMDVSELVNRLKDAVVFAGFCGIVKRTDEAKKLWHGIYGTLAEGCPGLLGSMTARREAQVMRMAMLYALLDQSREIQPTHLCAALALDQYSQDSCVYLFGDKVGDPIADTLLAALKDIPEGLTRTDISHDIFKKNVPVAKINKALEFLESEGLIRRVSEDATGGRWAERWFAV